VRCKRGIYKGDLAQVQHFDERRLIAEVKLIPRIEFDTTKKKTTTKEKKEKTEKGIKKEKKEIPAKLLQLDLITDKRLDNGLYIVDEAKYTDSGYLIKDISIKSLKWEGVEPTLDELQKFQDKQDENVNEELVQMASTLKTTKKKCI